MLQNRRTARLRRIPTLELLEDRTVLSGNVLVSRNIMSGQLLIAGDNGNNSYSINVTSLLGTPTLTVTGSLVPLASATAINGIPGGRFFTPLNGVNEIDITEGNGTNTVTMNGFSLPGSIKITAGTGVNTITLTNVSANSGVISFTTTGSVGSPFFPFFPVPSTSTDCITETNVVAGASIITTGSGNAKVIQSNVTFGSDTITTGAGSDTISITNSMFHPPPRAWAIGQLMINSGNGNDTIFVDRIDVGKANITAGTGKNLLTFDDSLIQTATITNGSSAGAGTTSLNFSNDTITGNGNAVTINLLNSSGINNNFNNNNNFFFFFGNSGTGSIYHVTMDNVQFTNSGNLSLTVDDGVPYVTAVNTVQTLQEASTVEMHLVDTGGHIGVNLGNHFQSVLLGQGTVGLNDLDAGSLDVSIGSDNDIVVVTANILGDGGDENVQIGDVTTAALGGVAAPIPSVLINGIWSNDGDENVNIKLGNNNNTMLATGWPVKINETVSGNLTIGPIAAAPSFPSFPFFFQPPTTGPNGLALNIDPTVVSGTLSVTLGNGGPGHEESLTLLNVTAADLVIAINSAATDFPDSNPVGGVQVNLTNVEVTDPYGGMTFTDSGTGVDTVNMLGVNVAQQLMMTLTGSGRNTLTAENVTACFGMINGGGGDSVYGDLGGNFGYIVFNFLGH
jgi:hypothetical protein